MDNKSAQYRTATLMFNPKGQTLEQLQHVIKELVGRAGCEKCGQIALLRADFLGDPPFEANGVVSYTEQGFR
jgi:hypothetical protein